MDEMEMIVFEIINNGGTAKSLAYEALQAAEQGNFQKSEEVLKEADQYLLKAHRIQSGLIQEEANGKKHTVSVLFVHAQDHLMAAMETRTLIEYLVRLYKRIDEK